MIHNYRCKEFQSFAHLNETNISLQGNKVTYFKAQNPFLDSQNTLELSLREREQLIDISTNYELKAKFKESELSTFWINLLEDSPEIAAQALKFLMRFPTTYLCEKTFSLYAATKNKYRNRLNAENDMKL
ncbi:zinc finger BED domain-containing protein 5-like [Palaemon carinicauda]|uniref:zinc finger BED domain-containing protein 5-like n=1 Tax=Palaemon carinicauda TaxID=392227 RepID=UPI0035B58CAA